jgi:nucleotide-binding universal stress UspA family protein
MSRSQPHHWHGGAAPHGRPVVVGVAPGQRSQVVREAGALARSMGVGLICVWSDASHVYVGQEPDGTVDATPLDPDQDDAGVVTAEAELEHRLERDLADVDVPWLFVYTVGEIVRALDTMAVEHDARLIAVGPRQPGFAGWMNQVIGGSIAGRLAHTQHRPVLIVPPAPRSGG